MASKTKVNLRDLMKKQQSETKSTSKRINSPLAKYNSLGQLWCVVCNAQVKSEIVWPAHIQGRKHKDNVAAIKAAKNALPKPPPQPPEPAIVRPPPAQPKSILKRRPDDPSVFSLVKKKPKVEEPPAAAATASGLPADFFDNASSTSSNSSDSKLQPTQSKEHSSGPAQTNHTSNPDLPADFFENSVSSSSSVATSSEETSETKPTANQDKTESNKSSNMAEVLPEGFFDDPVVDAKVRNVEVKNTMEEEWSKFQKEMETQQQVSENLQVEDEEEAQIERNIDEIDEQINCFAKVEALRDKQDAIKDLKAQKAKDNKNRQSGEDSSSSADEAEFDEFLDWRSKGAWK